MVGNQNSLFWGTRQRPNIPVGVNARDHVYQKAYKRFRTRLVQARKEAGLRQVEAARRLGRPNSFISKCELGERRVDVVELQQLAKIYRRELLFFLT